MLNSATIDQSSGFGLVRFRLRAFLYFTALTLPTCALLILFFDQPLALLIHRYGSGLVPFFAALTNGADVVHGWLLSLQLGRWPLLFVALLGAYVVGRWLLRRPGATLFLVVLLTWAASVATAHMLQIIVNRPRPAQLWGGGHVGFSFPSAHTADYFGWFLPLAVAFPRYRLLLLVLPVLIGLGRLVLGAHYLADVWFSVWLVAGFTCLFGQLLGRRWA